MVLPSNSTVRIFCFGREKGRERERERKKNGVNQLIRHNRGNSFTTLFHFQQKVYQNCYRLAHNLTSATLIHAITRSHNNTNFNKHTLSLKKVPRNAGCTHMYCSVLTHCVEASDRIDLRSHNVWM